MMKSVVIVAMGVLLMAAMTAGYYRFFPDSSVVILSGDLESHESLPSRNKHPLAATFQQAATFRGAQPDGRLLVIDGRLLINRDLRLWMDYYLSAVGEVSLDDIVEYMKAEMRTLPEPANREALDLLQAYLSYLASISEYDEIAGRKIAYSNIEELTARQQWVMDLRRLYFDDVTVAAFFAEDEAIDDFTLKRLELLQQGASPGEISALETRLPQPVQVARRQAASVQDSLQLRHQHSDPATLRQARSERFGNEAAERLAQLDEERAIWKSRLQQYHRFTQDQRGEPDYEVMVQAYRNQHFSVAEQRRLDAALISLQTARQPLGVGSVED